MTILVYFMNEEKRQCQNCKQSFIIEADDFVFYEKMRVPAPRWCAECRLVRRMMWRNERSLYRRECGLCGKEKIGMYRPDSPYVVYCKECWWSDSWDPMKFEREYDFHRNFFEQFNDLLHRVPRPGIIQQGAMVQSEYTNRASNNNETYLIFGSNYNEHCMYGTQMNNSKDSLDCYNLQKSELCYECTDCVECYGLRFSEECTTCSHSTFLYNCRNCQNCIGCVNLRNKSYCIFNRQYTKEDFERIAARFDFGSSLVRESFEARFLEFLMSAVRPAMIQVQSQGVSGNWIYESKNVRRSFNCRSVEDGAYLMAVIEAKDSMDHTYWGRGTELVYDSMSVGVQCSMVRFCNECWESNTDITYSMNCHGSSHLFGCLGLRKKEYCILNKQYTKEEYEALVIKIIEHMGIMLYKDEQGREYPFGEYFPPNISPWGYNEVIAQEYFPRSKDQVLSLGCQWIHVPEKEYGISILSSDLPDAIQDTDDGIRNKVIGCVHEGACEHNCTRAYRILQAELDFYRQRKVPLPRLCPNCRHGERLRKRNPMGLWERRCDCGQTENLKLKTENMHQNTAEHFHSKEPCSNSFESSYALERQEKVYCEQCYQMEVV